MTLVDIDSALAQLYERVTGAIFDAEKAEAAGDPGAAADAYLDVSFLEEEIGKLLPATDPEGEIARRGAITAALSAQQYFRAIALADSYLADPTVSADLGGQLAELKTEAEQAMPKRSGPVLVQPKARFRLLLAA